MTQRMVNERGELRCSQCRLFKPATEYALRTRTLADGTAVPFNVYACHECRRAQDLIRAARYRERKRKANPKTGPQRAGPGCRFKRPEEYTCNT